MPTLLTHVHSAECFHLRDPYSAESHQIQDYLAVTVFCSWDLLALGGLTQERLQVQPQDQGAPVQWLRGNMRWGNSPLTLLHAWVVSRPFMSQLAAEACFCKFTPSFQDRYLLPQDGSQILMYLVAHQKASKWFLKGAWTYLGWQAGEENALPTTAAAFKPTAQAKHLKKCEGYFQKWRNRCYLQQWDFLANFC